MKNNAYAVSQPGQPDSFRIARNSWDALDAQVAQIAVVSPPGDLVIPSCSVEVRRKHVSSQIVDDRIADHRNLRVCGDDVAMNHNYQHPRDARMHSLFPGQIRSENLPSAQQIRNKNRAKIEHVVDALIVEILLAKGAKQ